MRRGYNFFSTIILLVLLFSFACKKDPYVYTPLSGVTVIDTSEKEIVFDKPFKPVKQVNKVCFEYADKLTGYSTSQPPNFPDGTPLKISASVVDQNGKKYELDVVENSIENFLCIVPDYKTKWIGISDTDTTFIKLLVSSNRRINIARIIWLSYDGGDSL